MVRNSRAVSRSELESWLLLLCFYIILKCRHGTTRTLFIYVSFVLKLIADNVRQLTIHVGTPGLIVQTVIEYESLQKYPLSSSRELETQLNRFWWSSLTRRLLVSSLTYPPCALSLCNYPSLQVDWFNAVPNYSSIDDLWQSDLQPRAITELQIWPARPSLHKFFWNLLGLFDYSDTHLKHTIKESLSTRTPLGKRISRN